MAAIFLIVRRRRIMAAGSSCPAVHIRRSCQVKKSPNLESYPPVSSQCTVAWCVPVALRVQIARPAVCPRPLLGKLGAPQACHGSSSAADLRTKYIQSHSLMIDGVLNTRTATYPQQCPTLNSGYPGKYCSIEQCPTLKKPVPDT